MLAEPTISQAHPEAPQSWAGVLGVGFAIWLAAGTAGLLGGGLLLFGLETLLAGPEAQALASADGLALCGFLFAVPSRLR